MNENIDMPEVGNQDSIPYIEKQYHGKIISFSEMHKLQPELADFLNVFTLRSTNNRDPYIIVKMDGDKTTAGLQESYDRIHIHMFTSLHEIRISARYPQEDKDGYLGASCMSRVCRAGERWQRGNDLHDGSYNWDTWWQIVADIASLELVDQEAIDDGSMKMVFPENNK